MRINFRGVASARQKEAMALRVSDSIRRELCKRVVGISGYTGKDIEISVLTGGLTNQLYLAKAEGAPTVVIRVFVPGTDVFYDRKTELKMFRLFSDTGLGPKNLGEWSGGRFEEFLPGRTARVEDFFREDLLVRLAPILARIHRLSPAEGQACSTRSESNIRKWWNVVQNLYTDEPELLLYVKGIVDKHHQIMKQLKPSPVLLCHNDCQEGNILVVDKGGEIDSVRLVDFEYADYNCRGYDLGNMWVESLVDNFYHSPPHFKHRASGPISDDLLYSFCKEYLIASGVGEPDDASIGDLISELKAYSLGSHVLWGVWALIQAKTCDIPYGYREYAELRLRLFLEYQHLAKLWQK